MKFEQSIKSDSPHPNFFNKVWNSSIIRPTPGSFFNEVIFVLLLFPFFKKSKICWIDSSLFPLLLRSINSIFGPL